jgi:redox-sensitive bicupin YhaK (pirin superfamily)
MSAIIERIDSRPRDIGGFGVRRVLPYRGGKTVGPWVFFDHMGPAEFPAGTGIDVGPHPHIGLSTVTYLIEGEIVHRDSLGVVQAITPGAVNWMTAGSGITHSERTDPQRRTAAHRLHGIQTWVALPDDDLEMQPGFEHVPADKLPLWEENGASLRLLVGEAFGRRSPVPARSPLFYIHVETRAAARVALPSGHAERALYVVSGSVVVDGEAVPPGTMACVDPSVSAVELAADASVMLIGGAPLGKRLIWWNFVAATQERLERAKAEWRADHFARIPGEGERIPLPER